MNRTYIQTLSKSDATGASAVTSGTPNTKRKARIRARQSSAAVTSLLQRVEATRKLYIVIIGNGESDQDAAAFAERLVVAGIPFVSVLHGGIGSVLQEENSHLFLLDSSANEDYF